LVNDDGGGGDSGEGGDSRGSDGGGKYLYVDTYKLPHGTIFVLHIQNSHIQIDLRMLNLRQLLATICQNADGHVHLEHHPLLNWSTMMAAAATAAAATAAAATAARAAAMAVMTTAVETMAKTTTTVATAAAVRQQ